MEWGDQTCDGKGNILLHEINENNLNVINNDEQTFINPDPNKSNSAIDLTITSLATYLIITWGYSHIFKGAFQTYTSAIVDVGLYSQILTSSNLPHKKSQFIIRKKIDEEVSSLPYNINSDINSITKDINKIILRNKIKTPFTPKSWWNDIVQKAWEEKCRARTDYNQNRTIENQIKYKKEFAKFRFAKQKSKTKRIEEKLDMIDSQTTMDDLWALMEMFKDKPARTNKIATHESLAKEFLKNHFGPSNQKKKKKNQDLDS